MYPCMSHQAAADKVMANLPASPPPADAPTPDQARHQTPANPAQAASLAESPQRPAAASNSSCPEDQEEEEEEVVEEDTMIFNVHGLDSKQKPTATFLLLNDCQDSTRRQVSISLTRPNASPSPSPVLMHLHLPHPS